MLEGAVFVGIIESWWGGPWLRLQTYQRWLNFFVWLRKTKNWEVRRKEKSGQCWHYNWQWGQVWLYGYICRLWRPISTTITTTIFCLFRWKMREILLVVLFPAEAELIWSLDTDWTMSLQTWSFCINLLLVGGGRREESVSCCIWLVWVKYSLLCKLSLQVKITSCE